MLDSKEYERLQKRYRSLDYETLLDMLKNRPQDFLPEALQLIKNELKSRGYHDEDFAISGGQPEDESSRSKNENLTPVAKCPNGFVAQQAMDLLSQNGISSEVYEGDLLPEIIMGGMPRPDREMTIVVAAHDAQRAKEILADFPPMMEKIDSSPDSPDKQEK